MFHIYFGTPPPGDIWWIPILAAVITGGLAFAGVLLGLRGISEQIKSAETLQHRAFRRQDRKKRESDKNAVQASIIAITAEIYSNFLALDTGAYNVIVFSIKSGAEKKEIIDPEDLNFEIKNDLMNKHIIEIGANYPAIMQRILKAYAGIEKSVALLVYHINFVRNIKGTTTYGKVMSDENSRFVINQMTVCENVARLCRLDAISLFAEIETETGVPASYDWDVISFGRNAVSSAAAD